jgi:hypothetical protein
VYSAHYSIELMLESKQHRNSMNVQNDNQKLLFDWVSDFHCTITRPQVDMSLHWDTFISFRTNPSLLLLLKVACQRRSSKYQFHRLCFYLTGTQTPNHPHSRRAHWPLHPDAVHANRRADNKKGQMKKDKGTNNYLQHNTQKTMIE